MILYCTSLDSLGFHWTVSFSPIWNSGVLVLIINITHEYFTYIYIYLKIAICWYWTHEFAFHCANLYGLILLFHLAMKRLFFPLVEVKL